MKDKINSYQDLIVWQKAMNLTDLIYKLTLNFPKEELFGLRSQLRRCAVSIPSNIAEGTMRGTRKDYSNFLRISLGSSAELGTQVEIAFRQEYINQTQKKELESLNIEVMKLLTRFIKTLSTKTEN